MNMKNKITVYNKQVLLSLKDKYHLFWNKIEYKNKEKWLTGEEYPTYNQLVEISKAFNIPFGYLFLDELPEKKLPIIHFRTFKEIEYEPSDELIDIINQVKKQQEWAKDILLEWGNNPLPFAGKYDINANKEDIIKEIKSILGLESNWASLRVNWKDAFKYLIEKFEKAGIFVVISGIVGNNTHRKISIDECRGFVLYDQIAPFVFINNNDFISAKIFTLIHELVHILIGKSASFDLRELKSSDDEIEKFCDKCAAEFLVPESEINKIQKIDYEELAKRFKVSQIVIARRLLDTGKIRRDEFFDFYNQYKEQEFTKTKSKGGDFYNSVNYRYGKKFLEVMNSALKNKNILHRDVYRVLNLKPRTAEEILRNVI